MRLEAVFLQDINSIPQSEAFIQGVSRNNVKKG
jgi:hypothetical protein